MPPSSLAGLAIAIDVLIRVSVVLTGGLLLAVAARRSLALRHAMLVAALSAACVMPAAILALTRLPTNLRQPALLDRSGPDTRTADARPASHAGDEPPIRHDHAEPAVITGNGADSRTPSSEDSSTRSEPAPNRGGSWYGWSWPRGEGMAGGLLSILLFGAIVRLTGLGLSLMRLRRMVARANPADDDHVGPLLETVLRRIPMRRQPRLLESVEVSAPVAAGAVGDCILLPAGWARTVRFDEKLAILSHESAHLARRDHRVVLLQELLASVLWFHPLVHIFNRFLDRVREELCDNHAIAVVDRESYCEALLRLATGRLASPPRGASSVLAGRWSLEDRVRGLLDDGRPMGTGISAAARSATVASAIAACVLISLPRVTASTPDDRLAMVPGAGPPARSDAATGSSVLTREIAKSFPVDGKSTLRLDNLAGRVELAPGHGPGVEVEATIRVGEIAEGEARRLLDEIRWAKAPAERGESRWGLELPRGRFAAVRYPVQGELKADVDTVRYLGREVVISGRPGEATPSVEFDLRISIPPDARVAVRNAVGPISCDSVASPLALATRHGSIQLHVAQQPIDAASEFGDLLISGLAADAVLHTGSGGIDLENITRGRISLSTRSGPCRIIQPRRLGLKMDYAGGRELDVIGRDVSRLNTRNVGGFTDLLAVGNGGPSITLRSETGTSVVELAP